MQSEPEALLPSSISTDSSSHGGLANYSGSSSQREDEKNKTEDDNSSGSNTSPQDDIPVVHVEDIEVDSLRLTKAEPNSGTKHSQDCVITTNNQELTPPDAGLLTNELKNAQGASPCQNHPPPKISQPNKELLLYPRF